MIVEGKKSLKGVITVPGDRSISHRAIILGSLAKGTTDIDGFLMSEDCLSTIDCFRKMQVGIEILSNSRVKVHGKGLYGLKAPNSHLNAGKSGTTLRLLLGVLAGQLFNSTVSRDETAHKKPVGNVVNALRQMGAVINGKDDGNHCPLTISPSKLTGTDFELSATNSDIKSPILIAGLYAEGETAVTEAVKSRDHSELMLNYFGADIKVDGAKVIIHRAGNLYAQHIEVPGNISIASYFITAGLIIPNSDITIRNVGINPARSGIIDIYRSMGANMEISNERTVSNERVADIRAISSSLHGVTIEGPIISRFINEIPVIAVAASLAEGTTVIRDLSGFKVKESNRVRELVTELSKMGVSLYETEGGMVIEGGRPLKGTVIESYSDHTIAMAMSIAGLAAYGETMIRKAQVVDLVFPEFFNVLNKL